MVDWMVEVLPRLIAAKKYVDKEVPLLIPRNLHKNLKETLSYIDRIVTGKLRFINFI